MKGDKAMAEIRTRPNGIICPYCGYDRYTVIDTRPTIKSVRRRKKCLDCGTRITTYERIRGDELLSADVKMLRSLIKSMAYLRQRFDKEKGSGASGRKGE